MKNKKTYEVPAITVTEIETEDIILVSSLITVSNDKLLGSGKIEWIEIDLQ